ncbi:MAG: XisH family protein [Microcoleus sp. PH2017_17_BER_D_A]|nr:XisH family protein [Microcoleus sp. PH2017_17_BER_D_A]
MNKYSWAAKDRFHDAVKQALLKEQWVITADPLILKIDKVKFEIDLAAEKVFAAEKAGQKIAVEIKSFLNPSAVTDFHSALGQFLNYRLGLQMNEPDRTLYLAIPLDIFESFFQERFTQEAVRQYQVKLIVYEPVQEVIIEWKE